MIVSGDGWDAVAATMYVFHAAHDPEEGRSEDCRQYHSDRNHQYDTDDRRYRIFSPSEVSLHRINTPLSGFFFYYICMCLAEVKKPRDFTRLTQEDGSLSRGNLCNLVVS